MKLTEKEKNALANINRRQCEKNIFTNITLADIRREVKRMEAKR